MAVDNLIEEVAQGGDKKNTKKAKKRATSKRKKPEKSKQEIVEQRVERSTKKKDDNGLFNLIIAVVVILGIIGIIFGYTKDKISEINKGGTQAAKGLEKQVEDLKSKLELLQEKAEDIEADSLNNKSVVLDLFEKNRSIPDKVNASDWQIMNNENTSFLVSYPKNWEQVKQIIATGEQQDVVDQVYLQPIGKVDFLNAITIKTDYADFADLTLVEKINIFEDLDVIDSKEFDYGYMIYFVNLDKDNNEIPTILVLTENNIYRATFNITNKKLRDYFQFRQDFENIMITFGENTTQSIGVDGDSEVQEIE